jgi:chemotaxis protein CheD
MNSSAALTLPTEVFLHPGEFHFSKAPCRLGTLLGSCIAITVWHPIQRTGGMCHIVLPGRRRPHGSVPDGRYADEAVELFVAELRRRSLSPESCHVKLFGGGSMFAALRSGGTKVGDKNIEATRQALARHAFTPLVERVGGTVRRHLLFDLSDGHVRLTVPDNDNGLKKECA